MNDIRARVAQYYDFNPEAPNDVPFYTSLVPSPEASILELGCGYDRRSRIHPDHLILYPELIWRRYRHDAMVDEAVLKIPMRCYYPDEFSTLVTEHGFRIIDRWGGYSGEA